ncbi:6-pyruvoyl trahydropterin synthase family protein [Xylanibacter caecicola]|uniref:6-pyruvoyl trahydropterin synthase family protein n=1 Tax=Xylanibacter caecicola TaxID=2736294 RepID=UPI002582E419|nr:6-carboxytetrahydropterin synthase [Xylanibacter caecicola]
MYIVSKRMEIAGCHRLSLPYESRCTRMHGHNWIVTVHCKSKTLNNEGMVVDFKHIKDKIHSYLDHGNLNELLNFNPTAENIAKWICDNVPLCFRVDVEESGNNKATYIKDDEEERI